MEKKFRATCLFFKRDGYCATGEACQFSHALPTVACKVFFETNGKCRFGDACSFSHKLKESVKNTLVSLKPGPLKTTALPTQAPTQAPASSQAAAEAAAAVATEPPLDAFADSAPLLSSSGDLDYAHVNEHVLKSMWDFADNQEDDVGEGAYFYGAGGTFRGVGSGSSNSRGGGGSSSGGGSGGVAPVSSYAAIARRHAVEQQETVPQARAHAYNPAPRRPATACVFFRTGNCRYGARCLNRHELAEGEDSYTLHGQGQGGTEPQQEESAGLDGAPAAPSAEGTGECGICMAPRPDDGLYGILSHCDCVFCLACIRAWRLSGKEIASSSLVRLCPLCRNESHFTIPSAMHLPRGPRKDLLISCYKESLKRVVCKFAQAKEECPFGSSCFYAHPEPPERTSGLLHLVNANGDLEIKAEGVNLLEFVKQARRTRS